MKNKLTLNKDQIKAIKYFIRKEEQKHKFGEWDRFKITSLRVHSNGYYSFKIKWMSGVAGVFDDYWIEGNLFNEFPIFAVLDGLDAVEMLFHKIHDIAYKRAIEHINHDIKMNDNNLDHLKQIYKPGGYYNKEEKIIPDIRYE